MRTATRTAVAVHVLSLVALAERGQATSDWMAGSAGVHPVAIRNVLGMLRRAGLVETRQGAPGASLGRPLGSITLLDVFRAVGGDAELFPRHDAPNPDCPVGAGIADALDRTLGEAQRALEARLAATTLAEVVESLRLCPA
jgi:DNA-binding IscR family transcriptional regulator